MKLIHALPPVLALAGSTALLLRQHQEAGRLDLEIRNVRAALAAADRRPPVSADAPATEAPDKANPLPASSSRGPVTLNDLLELTEKSQSASRGLPDFRSMLELQSRAAELEPDALAALLEECETADLSESGKTRIQQLLLQGLSQKDPARAVMAAVGIMEKNPNPHTPFDWTVTNAFKAWAGKDPAAAMAWYDARTAEGALENPTLNDVNERRVRFESALMGTLLEKDPAAVRARLEKLSSEERKSALGNTWDLPVSPAAQSSYALMARELTSEKDQAGFLANYGSQIARAGKLEDVNAYLERIQATPQERAATVVSAAQSQIEYGQKVTVENSAEWRKWLQEQSGEKAPSSLGEVLGKSTHSGDGRFVEISALLAEVSPPGQQDQVTAAFLQASAWQAKGDPARKLAESIGDPDLRAKALKNLESYQPRQSKARPD